MEEQLEAKLLDKQKKKEAHVSRTNNLKLKASRDICEFGGPWAKEEV